MPIQFVSGDLFANEFETEAFAHGCNCQGSMGAGIAKGFRERYPEMYEHYRARCKAEPREFNLGDAWLWKDERRPWVFNLGTQEGYWQVQHPTHRTLPRHPRLPGRSARFGAAPV